MLGGDAAPVLRIQPEPTEGYRIDRTADGMTVVGNGAAALYAIADRVRSGGEVVADGRTVTPRLGLRLTDLGCVGLPDDPARYRTDDYSLNSDVVGDAILPDAPYVDRVAEQFRDHVDHSLAMGYNAVVVPGSSST